MNRRDFLEVSGATLAGSAAAQAAAEGTKPMILELRKIKLRNTTDNMSQRTNEYLSRGLVPAMQRAGVSPVGAFNALIAPDSPFVLLLTQYPNMAAWEGLNDKLNADAELSKARETFYAGAIQYVRMEVQLLRGFRTMPAIEAPPALEGKRSRIFEIRTYESTNLRSLAKKVRMFDEGEIALFRKTGIVPVFFGETIAGDHMPNLTYMVAFDDLAARDKAWSTFGSSPEWQKMRSQPGLSDGEIVSNISNVIVRPAAYSAIK